ASLRNELRLQLNVFLRVKTDLGVKRYFLGHMLSFHRAPLFHGHSIEPSCGTSQHKALALLACTRPKGAASHITCDTMCRGQMLSWHKSWWFLVYQHAVVKILFLWID